MKRLFAASVVAALTVGVAIPSFATARAAHNRGWVVCREHLILHISPPLTFGASHAARVNVSDVLEGCSSSDPTIDRGIAYITATSPGASCQSGTVIGVARIRWNNGRTSRVNFKASFAGGFAAATGHIAGGSEFIGRKFLALDHLNIGPVESQLCSTPSVGLGTIASDGDIAIGAPPTGGVVWKP